MSKKVIITNESFLDDNNLKRMDFLNEKYIVISPSQIVFQYEKDVMKKLKLKGLFNLDILNFDRFIYNFSNEYLKSKKNLNDITKNIILLYSLHNVNNLKNIYVKNLKNINFINELAINMNDMRNNLITSEYILNILENIKNNEDFTFLYEKLKDYNEVYSIYEQNINKIYDDLIYYEEFINEIEKNNIDISNINFYIEGFVNLNQKQMQLLCIIAKHCKSMKIKLNINDLNFSNPYELNVTTFINNFINYIKVNLKEYDVDVLFENTNKKVSVFAKEFQNIFENSKSFYDQNKNGIEIYEYENKYEEVDAMVFQITELLELGYKYEDIVVVTNDLTNYEYIIDKKFKDANFEYYINSNQNIINNSLTHFILTILNIVIYGFKQNFVLRFLKNKYVLEDIGFDEVCKIENTIYAYNISDYKFFTKFLDDDLNDKKDRVLNKVKKFREDFLKNDNSFKYRIELILNMLNDFDIINKIDRDIEFYEKMENFKKSNEMIQIVEKIKHILFDIYEIYHSIDMNLEFDVKEFYDILNYAFEKYKINTLPPFDNVIMIGDLKNMKIISKKILIFPFMNASNIPSKINGSAIFSDYEYEYLSKNYDINDTISFNYRYNLEIINFYEMLVNIKDRVIFTYSHKKNDTSEDEPSIFIEQLVLNGAKIYKKDLNIKNYIEEKKISKNLIDFIFKYILENLKIYENLKNIDYENKDFIDKINSYLKGKKFVYDDKIILDKEDDIKNISPTSIESFAKCPFQYYIEQKLLIKSNDTDNLNAIEIGNIIHYVLEKILQKFKKNVNEFEKKLENDKVIKEKILQYKSSEKDSQKKAIKKDIISYKNVKIEEFLINNDNSINYLVNKYTEEKYKDINSFKQNYRNQLFKDLIKEVIKKNVKLIIKSIIFNDQNIEFTEKKFTNNILELDLNLNGKIDRIDKNNSQINIIDYKTGNTVFSKDEYLKGSCIQLGCYLFTVKEMFEDVSKISTSYYRFKDDFFKNEDLKFRELENLIKNDIEINEKSEFEVQKKFFIQIVNDIIKRMNNNDYSLRNEDLNGSCRYCEKYSDIKGFCNEIKRIDDEV